MKRVLSLMLVTMVMVFSTSILTFADPNQTLDDVINEQNNAVVEQNQNQSNVNTNTQNNTQNQTTTDVGGGNSYKEHYNFVEGLNQAGDLSNEEVPGVQPVVNGAKKVAAFIVQILSYVIIAFLAVRVLLDLAFITLPFTRTFLANGYSGQAQSSGQGMQNMAGMSGMGMGMGNMGGGYGMNRMGGGYGMNHMGGMGAMGGMNNMAGQNAMMNRNSSMVGNVQFVSNAALNAVATESAIGPDGKTQSPFKIYIKDMAVTLTVTPILLILAATGVVTKFGFLLGGFVVDCIGKLGAMI